MYPHLSQLICTAQNVGQNWNFVPCEVSKSKYSKWGMQQKKNQSKIYKIDRMVAIWKCSLFSPNLSHHGNPPNYVCMWWLDTVRRVQGLNTYWWFSFRRCVCKLYCRVNISYVIIWLAGPLGVLNMNGFVYKFLWLIIFWTEPYQKLISL